MISPELSLRLISTFSWILIALGLIKVILYIIGEVFPGVYNKIKSEKARKFMTGTGNRLLFGLGGVLTVLLGVVFLVLGNIIAVLLGGNRF